MQSKSILDGRPVTFEDPKGFFSRNTNQQTETPAPSKRQLELIGACPSCGRAIYGNKTLTEGDVPISVMSCTCANRRAEEAAYRSK